MNDDKIVGLALRLNNNCFWNDGIAFIDFRKAKGRELCCCFDSTEENPKSLYDDGPLCKCMQDDWRYLERNIYFTCFIRCHFHLSHIQVYNMVQKSSAEDTRA